MVITQLKQALVKCYNDLKQAVCKFFESCAETLEEMRLYHRKNGKIVPIKDDLISSMRYAVLSVQRFGEKLKNKTHYRKYGFEQEIRYSNAGIV